MAEEEISKFKTQFNISSNLETINPLIPFAFLIALILVHNPENIKHKKGAFKPLTCIYPILKIASLKTKQT